MTAANIDDVSAVPILSAIWLKWAGMAGLFGFGTRRKVQG